MQLRTLAIAFVFGLVGCAAEATGDGVDGEDVAGSNEDLTAAEQRAARFTQVDESSMSQAERDEVLSRYTNVEHTGVRDELYESAILFFDKNHDTITNTKYLGIVDFAKHSGQRRFFVLDMDGGPMKSLVVAHGSGSDPDNDGMATLFSNVPGSNKSSLGFYETGEQYTGSHGPSLRLDGLSSTNLNVRKRAIVIHGATYVNEGAPRQGRSHGCLAVDFADRPWVLANLKGTILYAQN